MLPIYIDSATMFRCEGLQDPTDDTYINDATMSFELKDADGLVVAAEAMAYVAASDGRYEGFLSHVLDLGVPGTEYDLEVTTVAGRTDFRKIRCVAKYRGVR